jgi:spore germination cell wall hydrolase CwlJ-like protein
MNKTLLILAAVTVSSCSPCPAGIVADTLFLECRGESKAGQIAVASVIWNRSKAQGKTLEAVCVARKQFSCWNQGYIPVKVRNAKERALLDLFGAIEADMRKGTFKPSVKAKHYYAHKVCSPKWAKQMKVERVIGGHTFLN